MIGGGGIENLRIAYDTIGIYLLKLLVLVR